MHPVIEKTFGGLSLPYYLRQFVFGAAISAFIIFMSLRNPAGLSFSIVLISIISAGLYPTLGLYMKALLVLCLVKTYFLLMHLLCFLQKS
jgi:hypothetical protein